MGVFSRTSPAACRSWSRRAILRYSASARPARKKIGLMTEMVTSSVFSPRPTRFPAFTFVVPTRPAIGALMVV